MKTIGADFIQTASVVDHHLVRLDEIEEQIRSQWKATLVHKADEATVDAARGIITLRQEGRRLAQQLAIVLGFNAPISDAFSSAPASVAAYSGRY